MGCCGSTEAVNPEAVDLTHFDIMKVVGKGGFGKVNAVTKKDTQELMALKRMEKFAVLQSQSHLNMVWVERKIMSLQSSPFLCNLIYAFQSPEELYLVMPFMQGGDMRYHLLEHGPLKEDHARFYAAELLCAMADLHAKRVVFRDLKPENCLLDAEGHLRLSDFGLGHQLTADRRFQTTGQAGTKGYQAPEVFHGVPYACEVDVYSYGVTLYELMHGQRPFRDHRASVEVEVNANGEPDLRPREVAISSKLSPECAAFLRGLLRTDWQQRLGCTPRNVQSDGTFSPADQRVDWEEMRSHPFFDGLDWSLVYAKKYAPPFTPDISRANCSPEADMADQLLDHKPRKITPEQQANFIGWDFNTNLGTVKAPATATATSGTAPGTAPGTARASPREGVGSGTDRKGGGAGAHPTLHVLPTEQSAQPSPSLSYTSPEGLMHMQQAQQRQAQLQQAQGPDSPDQFSAPALLPASARSRQEREEEEQKQERAG